MTHDKTAGLRAAIEHAGYYPALIADTVTAATGPQPVTAFLVHHGALLDEDEVSRHLSVLALTSAALVCSHTDEYPPGPDGAQPCAETRTQAIRLTRLSSVSVHQVTPAPASYQPGVTLPSEITLDIAWGENSRAETITDPCGNDDCTDPHAYAASSPDDYSIRLTQAADGPDAIRNALTFAAALATAFTAAPTIHEITAHLAALPRLVERHPGCS